MDEWVLLRNEAATRISSSTWAWSHCGRQRPRKNNTFGIRSRLELRAGDLYQMRRVDQPVMHFGLGQSSQGGNCCASCDQRGAQSFYYPVAKRC